jgi:hypothetical protein
MVAGREKGKGKEEGFTVTDEDGGDVCSGDGPENNSANHSENLE